MVDACCYYGIYPEEINSASDIIETIISDYKLPDSIDDEIEYKFHEYGNLSDITNSLIWAMFSTVGAELDEMGIENDYYINGGDTHFYINGEEV